MNAEFWEYLQRLVDSSSIVIDRPKGSKHPRYAGKRYPVDYGYLTNTTSIDHGGVDIWVGKRKEHIVVGVLCTIDLMKRDTELKLLLGCSPDEVTAIEEFSNHKLMRAISITKEKEDVLDT